MNIRRVSVIAKNTNYASQAKMHLVQTAERTYCGLGGENTGFSTTDLSLVTCQRCLMYKTRPGTDPRTVKRRKTKELK